MLINISRVDVRRMGPGSFQWCPATVQRQWEQTEAEEVPAEHEQELHSESDGAREQVAQ